MFVFLVLLFFKIVLSHPLDSTVLVPFLAVVRVYRFLSHRPLVLLCFLDDALILVRHEPWLPGFFSVQVTVLEFDYLVQTCHFVDS